MVCFVIQVFQGTIGISSMHRPEYLHHNETDALGPQERNLKNPQMGGIPYYINFH